MRMFIYAHSLRCLSLSPITSKDMYALAEFCPKLTKFSTGYKTIECKVFKSLFAQLTELHLIRCDFIGNSNQMYDACTKLEKFYIYPNKEVDVPNCKFQKLTNLSFGNLRNTEFNIWTPLLQKNPQITTLRINGVNINDEVISNIVQYTNGIEVLKIYTNVKKQSGHKTSLEGLLKLADLKSLKQLSLHGYVGEYRKFAGTLTEALAVEQINISHLCLNIFQITSEDLKSIFGLQKLLHLELSVFDELTDKNIALIAKELPLLKHLVLSIDTKGETAISSASLVNMVRLAENLSYFELIHIHNVNIDQATFESLGDIIKKRGNGKLKMKIWACESTTVFSVPESIQEANRSTFQIEFSSFSCAIHSKSQS